MLKKQSQLQTSAGKAKKAHKQKKPKSPMLDAIMTDDESKIKQLIKEGVDVNIPIGATGETALHFAALFNKEKAATALIEIKADVNVTTMNHKMPLPYMARGRPLHSAAIRGNNKLIELLINARAEVNCYDEVLDTPLHNAVHYSYETAVTTLLASKADPTLVDRYNMTPGKLAYSEGENKIGDILAQAERERALEKLKIAAVQSSIEARDRLFPEESIVNKIDNMSLLKKSAGSSGLEEAPTKKEAVTKSGLASVSISTFFSPLSQAIPAKSIADNYVVMDEKEDKSINDKLNAFFKITDKAKGKNVWSTKEGSPNTWELLGLLIPLTGKNYFSKKLTNIGLKEGADFIFTEKGEAFSLSIFNIDHPALKAAFNPKPQGAAMPRLGKS